ncbi:MAG: LysR substrate-binding domain-containing protein [Pseudomonadota bacterium]
MDTRFAESLVMIVEEGSIAAAARRQGLTATALAQRVQALERAWDVSLVERAGQTVRPTAACQRLVPRLRRIVEDARLLSADLDSDGLSGPYRLGAIATALTDHATHILHYLASHAPRSALTIVPGGSRELYALLQAEELDAALMVRPPDGIPKALTVRGIETQRYVLVGAQKEAASDSLIVYDRMTWGGRLAWDYIQRKMPKTDIACEMDDPQVIAILAASGLGRAVLPRWRGLAEVPGLRISEIDSGPERRIVLATRGQPSALDRLLLKVLVK